MNNYIGWDDGCMLGLDIVIAVRFLMPRMSLCRILIAFRRRAHALVQTGRHMAVESPQTQESPLKVHPYLLHVHVSFYWRRQSVGHHHHGQCLR